MLRPPVRAMLLGALLLLPLVHAQVQQPCTDPATYGTPAPQTYCQTPDLIPENLTASVSDERFPSVLCAAALNIGNDSMTPGTGFYVSATIDGLDAGAQKVTSILHTGEDSGRLCWTASLLAGQHSFFVTADPPRADAPEGDVHELNERNNVATARSFFVRATPEPNLRISAFRVTPLQGRPGTDQFFLPTVSNVGNANSSPTSVVIEDGQGLYARQPVPALAPGESQTLVQYNLTDDHVAGNFTARAILDPDNATTTDCGASVNIACANFSILTHPSPDLTWGNVTVRGEFREHRGLLVDATLLNVGNRMASLAAIRAYDGDAPLFNASQANLPAGGSVRFQFYVVLSGGDHVLRLVADPDNAFVDLDRGNNAWSRNVTITSEPVAAPAAPNLVLERLDALPDDPAPNETVMVTALVRNAGDGPAGQTQVELRVDGILLGTKPVPPLPSARSFSVSFSWGGATEGAHALTATVDPAGTLNQTTRGDDRLERDMSIAAPAGSTPPPDVTPPDENGTAPPDITPPTATPAGPTPQPAPQDITVAALDVVTRDDGQGYFAVSVRNPNLAPVGRVSVEFRLDGKVVADKIINGIEGAGSGAQKTDPMDLPAGKHVVSADLKILGTDLPSVHVEKVADLPAGKRTPGPDLAWSLALVAAGALAWRRRRA